MNSTEPLISIICPTISPYSEIGNLFKSVFESINHYNANTNHKILIEFIIIDQIVREKFKPEDINSFIRLIYITSKKRGLSFNKNIGLSQSKGKWIIFLDSDCMVSFDFFKNFVFLSNKNQHLNHIIFKVKDFNNKNSNLRYFPNINIKYFTRFFKFYFCISINSIFQKKILVNNLYDEKFGLGAKFYSCEDTDFFYRMKSNSYYTKELIVLHPNHSQEISHYKLIKYSYGFGAFCSKHKYSIGYLLLTLSIIQKMVVFLFPQSNKKLLIKICRARIHGFNNFKIS